MKILILTLATLLANHVHASGCDHSDVYLDSENIVATLGNFQTNYECGVMGSFCGLFVSNSQKNENHALPLLNEQDPIHQRVSLGEKVLNIYDQYFVSSCGEEHRYVLGMDIDGKRYREEKDLDEM